MATQLDLQEQEQLDALKAFWNKQGSLITWVLVAVLAAFAAWNGWQWYQRDQATKAGAMYDELDRAARSGDAERVGRIFGDLRERYPRTAYAEQGGLLAAKIQFDEGQADAARSTLSWVADHAIEDEIRSIARLRLAALQAEAKAYDDALKTLDAARSSGFDALVDDRRGDVLLAQGKPDEARAAYRAAYDAMPETVDYRRLVDAKLTALGAPPVANAAVTGASGAAK